VLTESRPGAAQQPSAATTKVVVVIPIPNDPDWTIFEDLSEEIPIIVVDDSDGRLKPAPRKNVRFFDYAAQRAFMGDDYPAIPHKSAATRNFGHYLAYREGFETIIALDYDCRTRTGWLEQHLSALGPVVDGPALEGNWINSVEAPGFYARGYPYEFRNPEDGATRPTTATGDVKVNMGVWDNILDLNGIDKVQKEPPAEPGLRGDTNYIALGNIPVCGMNTAFAAELTPAYFFLPDVFVGDWQLSRHDDIWGGYVLKKIMQTRGDLFSYGRPVVEHTRQTNLNRVIMLEHWMHLMSRQFYEIVDESVEPIRPGSYVEMFAHFTDEFRRRVDLSRAPAHYRDVYRSLGASMQRWAECFR
jgi:hypothetical protein